MTRPGSRQGVDGGMTFRKRLRVAVGVHLIWLVAFVGGCVPSLMTSQPPILDSVTGDAYPTPALAEITRERREVRFAGADATLAGELDLPLIEGPVPLVFIIHHSGPVTRDAYGYMAELLTAAGFAVFRFDKRGVGQSDGDYGCCEAADALAAYQAAVTQADINPDRIFIVAQSIGTMHLAVHFAEFVAIQPPHGVVLLSSLLGPGQIGAVAAPVHVVVSDSEEELSTISVDAVAAHRRAWPFGATYFVAEGSEHTLFDITDGPIDWSDPLWTQRYHRRAMQSMLEWLRQAAQKDRE